ncbi:bile acid-sensitive ion channel-like [Oculina patagonica]
MKLQTAAAESNKSITHQKDDFIVWCEVRRMSESTTTCSSRNFTTLLSKLNFCFTFNGQNATLKVRHAGYLSGFSLILNIEADEHLPNPMEGSGVVIALHQPGELAEVEKTGLTAAPGTLNTITIKGKRIRRLGYPYGGGSDCRDETEQGSPYFQKECLNKCVSRHVWESCKCQMYPSSSANNACNYLQEEQAQCMFSVSDEVMASTGTCRNECPSPCTQDLLIPTISTASWPSEEFLPILTKSFKATNFSQTHILKDLQTARNNLLRIDVHYSTMLREHIIQKEEYTIRSLTSFIGGQLGLFVGMSILTITEFFEFFITLLMMCFSKRKANAVTLRQD